MDFGDDYDINCDEHQEQETSDADSESYRSPSVKSSRALPLYSLIHVVPTNLSVLINIPW